MRDIEQMLELLGQKRMYFLHYEKEMEELAILPAEEMEACLERGATIIKRIEELDGRLNQLLQQEGPMALSAVNHECDRGQLTPDLGKLYDASLNVKAVASRIIQNDDMIRQRIAYERDQALEKIKEINSRSDSVAGKYHRYTRSGSGALPGWQGKEA